MPERRDLLREVFSGLVDAPSPTSDQAESARIALRVAMGGRGVDRRRWAPRRLVPAAIAAVLALVVVLTAVVPWNRDQAEAYLAELAEATRSITPQDLPQGSYVYVASEQLVSADAAAPVGDEYTYVQFLLPSSIEAWWQGDTVRLETTVGRPVFFDSESEEFYYSNGLDVADSVGETRVDVFEGVANQIDPQAWSTDPDELALQMRRAAEDDPAEVPVEVKMLELAEELLAPHLLATPALRAALMDVLGTLGLDQTQLEDGRVAASVTYERIGFGTVTTELVFDGRGYLVERSSVTITGDERSGLPPGTVYNLLTQSPPAIVAEPGIRPEE